MVMFNNVSRQSIGSASMLSNSRLMTPLQNRAALFQFNSQVNGKKAPSFITF